MVPISGSYMIVTAILAVGLLHEKLNRGQILALVLVIVGIMTIGIG